jgi:hypothetical protein
VSEQTQASTESYVGQLVEQLRVLQERLRRIVEEVEREPGKQVTLAQDMADVHSETARLLLSILAAERQDGFLSARTKAKSRLK